MGPAGVGKSTYCEAMQNHAAAEKRRLFVANLDPAAEEAPYSLSFDIRDLITVQDVMEELDLGPNGGLLYCMEYLVENLDWLQEELDKFGDEDYLILDCPGQVELYSHIPVMRNLAEQLQMWGLRVCAVYLIDATFIVDASKFISGALLCLSAMLQLELPHMNVLSKCDLADPEQVERLLDFDSASMIADDALRPTKALTATSGLGTHQEGQEAHGGAEDLVVPEEPVGPPKRGLRLNKLTYAICSLLDDFTMVNFVPLNLTDEESIGLVLQAAHQLTQFGEDLEPKDVDEFPET